jgi:hypothetical protein
MSVSPSSITKGPARDEVTVVAMVVLASITNVEVELSFIFVNTTTFPL